MYQRDVNEIKAFVKWRGPDALVNTGLFVLLTIQAGLSTVKGSMVKVERDVYPVSYTHLTLPTIYSV